MAASDSATPREVVDRAVTALFVPGDRPDRFAKARSSGADLVILDLEDAVAVEHRANAEEAVTDAIRAGLPALVRIVGATDPDHARQRAVVAALGEHLLGVMIAKAEDAQTVATAGAELGPDRAVVALIESASGLLSAREIAAASSRLAFGALDFAFDLDATASFATAHAGVTLALVSRAAGLPAPLQSPDPELRDLAAVGRRAAEARALGFGGQLCIHPAQVPVVSEAFGPTSHEVAWARRVAGVDSAVTAVDGSMVDRPVLERARRILHMTQQPQRRLHEE